jgi:hypothetical protein
MDRAFCGTLGGLAILLGAFVTITAIPLSTVMPVASYGPSEVWLSSIATIGLTTLRGQSRVKPT